MMNFFFIIIAFLSGVIGVLNGIGSGITLHFFNLYLNAANLAQIQLQIYLANFIISIVFILSNFRFVTKNLFYFFLSLIIVTTFWVFGKIIDNQYPLTTLRFILIVGMCIIAFINLFQNKLFIESNLYEEIDIDLYNFSIFAFCALLSSFLQISFGAIFLLFYTCIQRQLILKELLSLIYFNMVVTSLLNFSWSLLKRDLSELSSSDFVFSIPLLLGSVLAMFLWKKISKNFIGKFILTNVLIYFVLVLINKSLV